VNWFYKLVDWWHDGKVDNIGKEATMDRLYRLRTERKKSHVKKKIKQRNEPFDNTLRIANMDEACDEVLEVKDVLMECGYDGTFKRADTLLSAKLTFFKCGADDEQTDFHAISFWAFPTADIAYTLYGEEGEILRSIGDFQPIAQEISDRCMVKEKSA